MRLMTFVGATMFTLLFAACDPSFDDARTSAPEQHQSPLGKRTTSTFGFDGVSVSLSSPADLDPNSDCAFAEGTANGTSTRYLVEDPSRMCPKGSRYRTCSLTTIASTAHLVEQDTRLELVITWKPAPERDEHLTISALALNANSVQIAMPPLLVNGGQNGLLERSLGIWHGAVAMTLAFRIETPCDGTGSNVGSSSTFGIISAQLVQDDQ